MIRKLVAAFLAWRRNRETQRLLYGLSDRTLHDIGLRREQIDYLRVEAR
jgi:uncharacterized protein YjiS (DUF1127 family)